MRRTVLKILAMFVLMAIMFGGLAVAYSEAFVLGIPVVGVLTGIALMSVSCPHCGYSVLYQEREVFGTMVKTFVPWPPKACPKCGKPL